MERRFKVKGLATILYVLCGSKPLEALCPIAAEENLLKLL
jgi:hypothetical protein